VALDADLDLSPDHCWTDLRVQCESNVYEVDIEW